MNRPHPPAGDVVHLEQHRSLGGLQNRKVDPLPEGNRTKNGEADRRREDLESMVTGRRFVNAVLGDRPVHRVDPVLHRPHRFRQSGEGDGVDVAPLRHHRGRSGVGSPETGKDVLQEERVRIERAVVGDGRPDRDGAVPLRPVLERRVDHRRRFVVRKDLETMNTRRGIDGPVRRRRGVYRGGR